MQRAPLFFYALCFLLGISSQLCFHPFYFLIFGLLLFLSKSRAIFGSVLLLIGYCYATAVITLPILPEEGVEGKGVFKPESIAYGTSPFGTSFVTKGTLETFITSSNSWRQIRCQIYTPLHQTRLSCDQHWIVEGHLLPKSFPHYVLKITDAIPDPSTYALAEWRFQMKDQARRFFASLFPQKEVSAFLLSMITGEIDDRLLSLQFNRLGLLHLLGVSGFQFSLLAFLLGSFLRLFLPGHKGTYVLLILLSSYAFILGNSPPIQRAWIGVTLYAIARMGNLQISPLNALGAALIWQLILDPCVIFHLGFQFSFLCTAAIFILYPPLRNFLTRWLPERSFSEIRQLSLFDRWGHTITFFCRETLALNGAIHLVSLPLVLYHFHKFPLLSLVYNLFLPVIISAAYLFLLPGLALAPFSQLLAYPFLKASDFLTQLTLIVATHPPTLFDFQWRLPNLSIGWALTFLTALLILFDQRSRLFDRFSRR